MLGPPVRGVEREIKEEAEECGQLRREMRGEAVAVRHGAGRGEEIQQPRQQMPACDRGAMRGEERVKTASGRAVHLNQKPLDLMSRLIEASTDVGDVIWEPFGGLFTASLAAKRLARRAFGAEIDSTYFQYGVRRFV